MNNQFDFDSFNKLTNSVAPGLQIALAEGLIRNALYSLERYNNPLTDELFGINQDLKTFRVTYKAAADARKKAQPAVANIEN